MHSLSRKKTDEERHEEPDVLDAVRDYVLFHAPRGGDVRLDAIQHHLLTEWDISCSRMPIRTALQQLQREGLVDIEPKARTKLCLLDEDQVREVLVMRHLIEERVAHVLARSRSERVEEAVSINARIVSCVSSSSVSLREYLDLDARFHEGLTIAAGFETTFARVQRQMTNRLLLVARPAPSVFVSKDAELPLIREHQKILDAIRSGKTTNAVRAASDHIVSDMQRWHLLPMSVHDFLR